MRVRAVLLSFGLLSILLLSSSTVPQSPQSSNQPPVPQDLAQRKVELHVSFDPKQLLLQVADNHRKGGVDLYFVQRDATGETVAAENQRVGLNFEEKQYEYLSTAGVVLGKHLTISSQSADVRVFARDTSSEALGSVTIPVQALFEGPQTASNLPAKIESRK